MKIDAMVTTTEKDFQKQTLNLAEPKAGEVLVRLVASGVCHTDATVLDRTIPVPSPVVLGHEALVLLKKSGKTFHLLNQVIT